MNRKERRRQEAMARHNRFVKQYVNHLPELSPEQYAANLGKTGITHVVCYNDD
jgi:hypothetical protein